MKNSWGTIVPLLAVILASAIAHAVWFGSDRGTAFWDQHRYYVMALDARARMESGAIHRVLDLHESHAPLQPILSALWSFGVGREFRAVRWINGLFLLAQALVVFALGRRLIDRSTGLLSAAIVAFLPYAFRFGHLHYTENLLAPLVVATILAATASDGFRRPGLTLLTGVLAGLGLLTRWTFPLYVFLPLAAVWVQGGCRKTALMGVFGLIAVAGPWYVHHLEGFFAFTERGVTSGDGHLNAVTGLAGWMFYGRTLITRILGIPTAIVAALGFVTLVRRRRGLLAPTLGPILVSAAAFTLLLTKAERHLVPALGPLAIAIAATVTSWPRWIARVAAIGLLLHLVAASLVTGLFGKFPAFTIWSRSIPLWVESSETAPAEPLESPWPREGVLAALLASPPPHHALMTLNHGTHYRMETFDTAILERSWPVALQLIPLYFPPEIDSLHRFPLRELLDADALVVKSGTHWVRTKGGVPVHWHGSRVTEAILDPRDPLQGAFVLVEEVPLPDGSATFVYHRRRDRGELGLAALALRYDPDHDLAWSIFGSNGNELESLERAAVAPFEGRPLWPPALVRAERARRGGSFDVEAAALAVAANPDDERAWRALSLVPGTKSELAREVIANWEAARVRPDSGRSYAKVARMLRDATGPTPDLRFDADGLRTALLLFAHRALLADRALESELRNLLAPEFDSPIELRSALSGALQRR